MNKIIPLSKDIHFKDKIGEIESIKIDNDLKFDSMYSIVGNLVVTGSNHYQDLVNDFCYPLPVEITVDPKYDTNHAMVTVDDFYYEIINEDILRVNIDLCLDDLEYREEEIEKESRTLDFNIDMSQKEDLIDENVNIELDDKNFSKDEEKKEDNIENKKENQSIDLFKELPTDKEYSVYRVYTFLENDTLDSLLAKYKITKEELEIYNDLSHILPGMKIIIPSVNE